MVHWEVLEMFAMIPLGMVTAIVYCWFTGRISFAFQRETISEAGSS